MLKVFTLDHPSPQFSTEEEARRGQEAGPPHICTTPQPSLTPACCSWDVFGCAQTPAWLVSAGARMGTVTPAHAAVAQLPLVLCLFVFLPDKRLHTAGGACLQSQSH